MKRNMDIRSDAGQASPKGEGISVDWALSVTHQDEGRVEASPCSFIRLERCLKERCSTVSYMMKTQGGQAYNLIVLLFGV